MLVSLPSVRSGRSKLVDCSPDCRQMVPVKTGLRVREQWYPLPRRCFSLASSPKLELVVVSYLLSSSAAWSRWGDIFEKKLYTRVLKKSFELQGLPKDYESVLTLQAFFLCPLKVILPSCIPSICDCYSHAHFTATLLVQDNNKSCDLHLNPNEKQQLELIKQQGSDLLTLPHYDDTQA